MYIVCYFNSSILGNRNVTNDPSTGELKYGINKQHKFTYQNRLMWSLLLALAAPTDKSSTIFVHFTSLLRFIHNVDALSFIRQQTWD